MQWSGMVALRAIALLLATAAPAGCGGRTTSGEGPTDTRTVGSVGDGPAYAGDAGDADASDDIDGSLGFEAGASRDAAADTAPDPFADAAACAARPFADCSACDSGACPMPMLAIAQAMIDACRPASCPGVVGLRFDADGCAIGIVSQHSVPGFIDCFAAKLSAQRFSLSECTFGLENVSAGDDCTTR